MVLVRVEIVAVSLQITVETQDVLQVCTALVSATQLTGAHKVPQALVVTALAHAEDRVGENSVNVFEKEDVRVDVTSANVFDREDVRMDETIVDVIDGLELPSEE